MPNIPLEIPPGVVKTDSPNAAKGRYTDADKVRFVKGKPQKWRGWQKLLAASFVGFGRGMMSWANAGGSQNIGLGTHIRLYAIQGGDTLTNITPIQDSGSLGASPFATVDTTTTVTVTDTAHVRVVGDFVTFASASVFNGIDMNGEFNVATLVDANTYTIEHTSTANNTGSGGGTPTYSYELNIGTQSTIIGLGWGAGTWGSGFWGTPRTAGGVTLELRSWSLAEHGNDLLANPNDGGLYRWIEGTDDQAVIVTNAPTSARAMFVTGERFVTMLGTTSPMTMDWADRDDITDWTPTSTNTANTRTLASGSKLICGTELQDTTNIIWTDTSVYEHQFTGSDFVYDTRLRGTECGLIGQMAFTIVRGTVYWLSGHHFHMYSGSVQLIPNQEDIRQWVFENMDMTHITKTWAGYNPHDDTVIFGYVTEGNIEPDSYVELSLHDYSWSIGTLDRTIMSAFRPQDASVVMAGTDGFVWEHEVGTDDDSSAINAHITFGLYSIRQGGDVTDIMGFIPDCEKQTGDLSIELVTQDRPQSTSNKDSQTLTMAAGDEIGDARLSGRHFTFTVRSNVVGGDFRLGIPALEIGPAGSRR